MVSIAIALRRFLPILGLWMSFGIITFAGQHGIGPLAVLVPLFLGQSILWIVAFVCCGHVPSEGGNSILWSIASMTGGAGIAVTFMSILARNDRRYLRLRALGTLILAVAAVAGGVAFALSAGPGWNGLVTWICPLVPSRVVKAS